MTKRQRAPRVFLGLTEVASYYTNLKHGFDALGVPCTFVDFGRHPFRFDTPPHWATRAMARIWPEKGRPSRLTLLPRRIASLAVRVGLLVDLLVRHDVIIFGYLSTLFRFHELPLLKLMGKRVIYVFHGSDSRPPYVSGYQADKMGIDEMIEATRTMKANIREVERHATAIVCTPIHTQLHERPVVKYQSLGLPIVQTSSAVPHASGRNDGSVRILHAPSSPKPKGTAFIRAAVESLRQRYPIEYVELTGRTHAEVIAEIQRCDFVVDQLNGEGPCGGLATEAASFGKPAIVGTHTDDIWRMFGSEELPPVLRCENEEVEAAIERLIVDSALRLSIGERAREFVHRFWTPAEVARRFLRVASGDVPSEWMYDPASLRYLWGAGFTRSELTAFLVRYLAVGGEQALQLDDKPLLARDLVSLSEQLQ